MPRPPAPPVLAALQELLRAVTTVPLDLPASAISRARKHVQAMEEALARGRELPEALEIGAPFPRLTRDVHRRPLAPPSRPHRAPRVPAPRRRGPARPAARSSDASRRRSRVQVPLQRRLPPHRLPIAAVETRELLAAAAQQCGDDPAMTQTVERASAELARIIPELTTAQALQAELDELDERLQAGRARLAELQNEVHAVSRRMNSRLLNTLRLPARSKREAPEVPAIQGVSALRGWPSLPPEAEGSGAVLAHLDFPEAPAIVLEGEPLVLVGWALTPQAPVGRVEVLLDGQPAGRARLGLRTRRRSRALCSCRTRCSAASSTGWTRR